MITKAEQTIKDIEVHMDMLLTPAIQEDACISRTEHDLPFQVFRLLSGYAEALATIENLERKLERLL